MSEGESICCYHCKEIGHFVSACPLKKAKKRPRESNELIITSNSVRTTSGREVGRDAVDKVKVKCYRCHQVDSHYAKECPQKRTKTTGPSPPSSSPSPPSGRLCYKCKGTDHLAHECPSLRHHRHSLSLSNTPPLDEAIKKRCFRCHSHQHSTLDCTLPKPCFYCDSHAHLAAECPNKRQILRERSRAASAQIECSRCGVVGHIARLCPSLAHRAIRRNEDKPRALACYICDKMNHHAVECPDKDILKNEVLRLCKVDHNVNTPDVRLEDLFELCSRSLDYASAAFLYTRASQNGDILTARSWQCLESLVDKSGQAHASVEHPLVLAIKKPRSILQRAVKDHRAGISMISLEPLVTKTCQLLAVRPELLSECSNRFALCKALVKIEELKLSAGNSRAVVAQLAHRGHLVCKKKSLMFYLEPESKVSVSKDSVAKSSTQNRKQKATHIKTATAVV